MSAFREMDAAEQTREFGQTACFVCRINLCDRESIGELYLRNLPRGFTAEDAALVVAGDAQARLRLRQAPEAWNRRVNKRVGGVLIYQHMRQGGMLFAVRSEARERVYFDMLSVW